MSRPNLDGYEVSVVELDHKLTVVVVDHANRRLTAWSLIDGEWTEANVAEAVHEGRIPLDGAALPSLSELPPLPDDIWSSSGRRGSPTPGTVDLTKPHYNSKMNEENSARVGAAAPRFLADAPRQLKTSDAWMRFAHELATALQGLEEDEWLVLSLKRTNRFAQFMNQGGAGYRAETVSDFYLEDGDRLSESDRATLLDLGWEAPTNLPDEFGFRPDGSPNYFVDLANPVPLHELAALAVATMINVHRAPHPNALQYSTGGGDRSIRFPNLGIRRAPDTGLPSSVGVTINIGNAIQGASPLGQRQALIALATSGDADAQARMSDLCRTGDELTAQDFAEAMKWYRLAAAHGDPNAQNNIGAMYDNAMGVPENMAEAAKWYRRSADQGFAMAQYNLGVLHRDGKGVPKNPPAAAKWFRLAAAQGMANAQYNLALLVGFGEGVPMDEAEATSLLHKAASQGHIAACTLLGTLYRFGDGVEKRIPLAAEFHVIAALEGDKDAISSLADYRGDIEQEALNGRMLAALCLAKMYDRGLGVEENRVTEYAWLLWGHKHGNRNEDSDVAEELDDMREFYGLVIPDADKREAEKLVKRMSGRTPKVAPAEPKRRAAKSRRGNRSATL